MGILEFKRPLGLAYLVGMGFLLGSIALLHLSESGEPFLGKILSLAALLGLAVPLLWSAYWLWSREFTSARVCRAVGWSVAGMGTLTTLAVITVFYERSHGIYLADASVITLWVAGTGQRLASSSGGMTSNIGSRVKRYSNRQIDSPLSWRRPRSR